LTGRRKRKGGSKDACEFELEKNTDHVQEFELGEAVSLHQKHP